MAFEFSPHIAVEVKDWEKAVAFYRDVLGMELKRESKDEAELGCGLVTFYVENNPQQRTWLEFRVDDVEAAKAALEAAGCEARATRTPEGSTSYLVSDPFGLRFHIFQR
jgi:catechol 2,3-dioxygenase-like lactoylglutathione lyase family enzyme